MDGGGGAEENLIAFTVYENTVEVRPRKPPRRVDVLITLGCITRCYLLGNASAIFYSVCSVKCLLTYPSPCRPSPSLDSTRSEAVPRAFPSRCAYVRGAARHRID